MPRALRTARRVRAKATSTPAAPPVPPAPSFGCPVERLKIGAFDYRIVWSDRAWQEREKAYGLHDPERHEIILSTTLNRRHLADIILHEINHAVWLLGRMDDVAGEENFCARHATTLTSVESHNLAFFRWRLSLLES